MQAVIMAAGKGVRMLPLTSRMPKPLLKINGKAIIDYTIEALPGEIDEVVVLVGYLGDQIKEYLKARYPDRKFTFVEVETLGTGYAVSMCKPYLKDDFIVLNGDDLYRKEDISQLLGENLAILVKDVSKEPGFPQGYARFGRVAADENGNFMALEMSVDDSEHLVVIGAYKLNKKFFSYDLVKMPSGEYGLPQTLFSMSGENKIKVIKANFWVPIGFPEDIAKAEAKLNE
jgi:NDP-sugar pyrophosphorylase family protein